MKNCFLKNVLFHDEFVLAMRRDCPTLETYVPPAPRYFCGVHPSLPRLCVALLRARLTEKG